MEKYTPEEVVLLNRLFSGDLMIEEVYGTLVKDPELKELCKQIIEEKIKPSEEEVESIELKIVTNFAKNIRKKDIFGIVESANVMQEEFIDAIIHHPEFYEGGLDADFLIQLMSYSDSLSFFEGILNDDSLQLDPKVEEAVTTRANQIKAEKQKIKADSVVIIDVINGNRSENALLDIITDEQLLKEAEDFFNFNNLSPEKRDEISAKLFQFLATRFDEVGYYNQLQTADNNVMKIGLIDAVLDKEDLGLTNWEIINLLKSTDSPELIQKIIDSEKMQNFSEYEQENLRDILNNALTKRKIADSIKIINILDGNESADKILGFITDPELREKFQEQLNQEMDVNVKFGPELLEHLASKLHPTAFFDVENMKTKEVKIPFIDKIIHHPEFYNGISSFDMGGLITSTDSVEFMTQALSDESLQLDYYAEQDIRNKIDEVIKKEKELAKQKDSQTIIDVLSGLESPEKLLPLIEDESMRKRLEDRLNVNPNLVGQDAEEIDQDIMEHLASKISKKHLDMIKTSIESGPNKNGLVDAIIHHPEYFPDGLTQSQYRGLITSTESVEYMKKILQDPELFLSSLTRDRIQKSIRKEERKNRKPSVLDYTEEEAKAVKTYEGVSPGSGPLSSNGSAYKTMNAMLFPGLDNEFARIYEDHQDLIDNAVRNPEELLELSTLLYTAMYKYGKKMQEPVHTTRVDRSASFPEMEKRGQIISNFSTSLKTSYVPFRKAHITLVQAEIQPGTACLEFGEFFEELGDLYEYSSEREILIAPFSPITMTEEPMTQEELQITDTNGRPPDRKIKMIVNPPPKARPLSTAEKADRAKQESIFRDPTIRKQAALFLSKLHQYSSKEEAIRSIPQEEFEQYVEWKAAFQSLLKYRIREISLEIDKALAAERGEEFVVPEPPESPELTVVPELPWKAETLELPSVQGQNIQSYATSWDPDQTEELPIITEQYIQNIQNNIQKFYKEESEGKSDPKLMEQLASATIIKPLSKINKAISNFAEKLSLKLKGNKPKGKDDDARDC